LSDKPAATGGDPQQARGIQQQTSSRQTAGKQQISSSTQSAAGITSASARHSALSKRFDRWVDQHNRLDASLDIALNFTSLSLTNRQTRGKREADAKQARTTAASIATQTQRSAPATSGRCEHAPQYR